MQNEGFLRQHPKTIGGAMHRTPSLLPNIILISLKQFLSICKARTHVVTKLKGNKALDVRLCCMELRDHSLYRSRGGGPSPVVDRPAVDLIEDLDVRPQLDGTIADRCQ